MVNSQGLEGSLFVLLREEPLLRQILHRNSNQHSCTKLFGYLKTVHRELVALQLGSLGDLASSELRQASSKKRKLLDEKVNSVRANVAKGKEVMLRCSKVAFAAIRCFTLLQQYLREKLFLPLYTTLLALTASILHSICAVMVHFDDHIQMMAASVSEGLTVGKLPFSVELARSFVNKKSEPMLVIDDTLTTPVVSSPSLSPPPRVDKEENEEEPRGDVVVDMAALMGGDHGDEEPAPKKAKKSKKAKKAKKEKSSAHSDEIDEIFSHVF